MLKKYIDVKYKYKIFHYNFLIHKLMFAYALKWWSCKCSKIVFKYIWKGTQIGKQFFAGWANSETFLYVKPQRICKSLWSNPVKSFLFLAMFEFWSFAAYNSPYNMSIFCLYLWILQLLLISLTSQLQAKSQIELLLLPSTKDTV